MELLIEVDKPARPSKAQEAGPSKAPEGRSSRIAIKRLEGGTSKAMTDRGKGSQREGVRGHSGNKSAETLRQRRRSKSTCLLEN